MLRKSGVFTSLDFAPPRRFRDGDTGSDAGSMRSGRSGRSGVSNAMSHAQLSSLRAGAYRMSRLPKDLAGTRDELMTGLKPQWDLTRPG
jgi:hypothetical protein